MIAWWKGEADGLDSVGGNDGTLLNGVSFVPGKIGQGFSFDGVDDRIVISNSPALNFDANQEFSIEGWIQPLPSQTDFDVMSIVDKRYAPNLSQCLGYELNLGAGRIHCRLSDSISGNGLEFGPAGPDLRDGAFHHVALVVMRNSSAGGKLCVDGQVVWAFDTTGLGDLSNGEPLRIGNHASSFVNGFFKGTIDELSIYRCALSASEIQAIFNAGTDGKCPLSTSLSIISNPSSASVFAGSNVTFSVMAVGSGSLHYQWWHEDVLIPGAIQSSLILSNVQAADEGNYSVVVTNLYRSATSSNALLTVIPLAPSIIVQPKDRTVYVGSNATFSVAATGTQPMTYQWRFNELDLPGRTNASLTITNAQLADGGYYSAVVSNRVGFTTSSNALLTVKLPPPCTPPPAGLVAWWRFENDLLDNWGINNATAPYSRTFTAGKVGRAFNLASSYLIVPDSPSLRFTNALTVECWVNSSSFAGSTPRTILSKFDSPTYQPTGAQSSFYLGTTNNGSVYFVVSGSGSVRTNTSLLTAQTLPANQWSFVVATYDGASLRIYINGTLAAQKSYSSGIFAGSAPLGIGALPFATQSYTWPMPALIDEVALYNRALSESEVQSIYESDFIGKCLVAPEITVQPLSQPAPQGEDVQFSVSVLGSRPLKFQWRFNGTNILGATNSNLVLEKVRDANTGFYSVAVSNAVGGIVSASAQLKLLPAPECISVPEGLISWWPVDGSGVDAAGGNNVPSVYSTVYVTGKVDRALSFNGYSSRVTIASSASLNFSSNVNFSIEGWVKAWPGYSPLRPPFPPYPNMPILEKRSGSDATGAGYSLSLNQGRLAFWLGTASKTATNAPLYISNGPDLRDGMFHHIAATVDRSSTNGGNLFVDGALVFTFDPTTRTGDLNNTSTLYIGAPTSTTANSYFYGLIDEMAMYRRALSADEIHSIATAGSAGKCKVPPSIVTQPLDQVVKTGSNATFTVLAVGSPTLRYQWFKGTASLAWATNSAFSITNAQGIAAGLYSVKIANAFGSITSSNAVLTVEPLVVLPSGGVLQFSQGGDQWTLKFTGVAGLNYQVQTSTNLVDWTVVGAATDLGDGRFEFVDPDAMSREAGFYRIVQP
ncbi:MAG: LamG-like jellyroll fold domain-containing protein [Verrucomicrobiota bacterium]